MKSANQIQQYGLCLGCGLCEAVTSGKVKMKLNDKGFYSPDLSHISEEENKRIMNVCPGIRVSNGVDKSKSIWGDTKKVVNAWAEDNGIRHSSSSGGVTSALALYLLESGSVDGVLQVRVADGSYLYNKLTISRTREDILKCNASRYAPALIFSELVQILDKNPNEKYAFIGKPCDIAGIRNFITEYPEYKDRITHFLSIFCAGMPSYNATKKALGTFEKSEEPVTLRYRGDGWPGFFKATYKDGSSCQMTYNESWGNILGRDLGFRCKICPDGIGMLADISSGDSWNTKNGYPDFTESDGKNFCFIRTQEGVDLLNKAANAGYVHVEELNIGNVRYMQKYQYIRRQYVGWRIAVVQLCTKGLLYFRGLGYYRNALTSNIVKGLKELLGTYRRLNKIVCQKR